MIDFKKSLRFSLILFYTKTLEIFGFGQNFRKWINILLGNSETRKKLLAFQLEIDSQLSNSRS